MAKENYLELRNKRVVKANELIQQSRFSLSLQQQKIVLFLISQINYDDEDFKLYEFDIRDFCKVCGLDYDSGGNYSLLKEQIKAIRDKSLWITLPDGRETTIAWIEKPYIDNGSGKITIRLDNDMKPFLLQLKRNFTQYELIFTLRFKSKYSIRLYELIKSIHFHELEIYKKKYSIDELRKLLDAENHKTYQHFKEKVLEIAVREINEYSDKVISYQPIKEGRKVVAIGLTIKSKNSIDTMIVRETIDAELGYDPNQLSLFDDFQEGREEIPLTPEEQAFHNKMIEIEKEVFGDKEEY